MTRLSDGSLECLAERYDTALVDLDGVVYVGPRAVDGAAAALAAARAHGMRTAFVTNNASRTPEKVAAHLTELGIEAGPGDVVTSAQAAAGMVAGLVRPGARVLVVGGEGLDAAVRERGLVPVPSADASPEVVVQGFAPEVGWAMLAEASYAVSRGLPWVASNLDRTVPTPRGLAPGNGALVGVVAAATGATPLVAGKPEPPLHREAVRRTGARSPIVVGDRLDTDVAGANRCGADSLLVLTGVANPSEILGADDLHRPTYVAEDLGAGLLEPHPAVGSAPGGERTCGGWTCTVGDGVLRLAGDGHRIDALRAMCVSVWSAEVVPDGLPEAVRRAGW
ncbi:MAG: HAD-IIA family hydrolase [Actinomycetes bacterium]